MEFLSTLGGIFDSYWDHGPKDYNRVSINVSFGTINRINPEVLVVVTTDNPKIFDALKYHCQNFIKDGTLTPVGLMPSCGQVYERLLNQTLMMVQSSLRRPSFTITTAEESGFDRFIIKVEEKKL